MRFQENTKAGTADIQNGFRVLVDQDHLLANIVGLQEEIGERSKCKHQSTDEAKTSTTKQPITKNNRHDKRAMVGETV